LPANVVDVRAFGAHESQGVWAVYAGVDPTGILRGVWSKTRHTLVFGPTPELTVAARAPAAMAQKVTAFADCGGALYASVNTMLYRRNDGAVPAGGARWALVYQEPPVGPRNSGLRGLTCISYRGAPALLLSTEGSGDVWRLGHLPAGQLDAGGSPGVGRAGYGMTLTLEFSPIPAIRQMLASQGTTVPAAGRGSISYVIAAYNNFVTVTIGGITRQLFGFEWGYKQQCPPTRICGPVTFGATHYDAAACFAIRTSQGPSVSYAIRCLSGPAFTLTRQPGTPIRSGQAFVSIRTIALSPFGNGQLYYGGYDCNYYPADGTAWIASAPLEALHLNSG
jgi:hypothetical protein